ncbi:Mn2+-dependent serine/threonine protein kinase [Staphylothermus marinus F1]|uniref:non-specific serine/threonine protein kinase n=1 Tax=Staphylothermus marinus (strain ATCC 43588 / DSM 3639 / JCM 9404 / F1) TaxID=399550 RepID=A3DMT0_STAMF|nr:Kae1-associated kinase Bud32 [Staphylothermus marinus]ABN69940.1 Mn2+-dependent serine/threonine protein kinase [Staphylothermus marinus F1]
MDTGLKTLDKGAEALLFLGNYFGKKVIVKYRVSKPYRHPRFDEVFRYSRTKTEAKILSQLYLRGLNVPAPLMVDLNNYVIVMQYIEGVKLINIIDTLEDEKIAKYAYDLGFQAGIMHSLNIYHGDLTLANIVITSDEKVYIIDFGLAGSSRDIEEYAIDIHLLRRSLQAIVPDKTSYFMKYFRKGYIKGYGEGAKEVFGRVEEIRLRGRYVEERLRKKYLRETYIE